MRYAWSCALFLALLFAPPKCEATLYSTAGGYQYTGGSPGYWDHELWAYGNMRLAGGWYPFGRLTAFTDSVYDWGLAPSLGLEKGFPGLGRGRAAYTLYQGSVRHSDLQGTSHGLELGWFRAFTPEFSADLAYRLITGDLFGGVNQVYDLQANRVSSSLMHETVHQALLTLGVAPSGVSWKPRLEAGLSASYSRSRNLYSQALNLSLPVYKSCYAQSGVTLAESQPGPARTYLTLGLFYAFSGRLPPRP